MTLAEVALLSSVTSASQKTLLRHLNQPLSRLQGITSQLGSECLPVLFTTDL